MTAWRSNLGSVKQALQRADKRALETAIALPFNQVKQRLSGPSPGRGKSPGYTSGDFAQGVEGSAALLAKTDAEPIVGGHIARYGFQAMPVPYPLYWELGHFNLYTRRFERVPIVVPALYDNADKMVAAYRQTFARLMSGHTPPPTDPDPTREAA